MNGTSWARLLPSQRSFVVFLPSGDLGHRHGSWVGVLWMPGHQLRVRWGDMLSLGTGEGDRWLPRRADMFGITCHLCHVLGL